MDIIKFIKDYWVQIGFVLGLAGSVYLMRWIYSYHRPEDTNL